MLLVTQRLLNLQTPRIRGHFTVTYFLRVACSGLSIDTFPCSALPFFHFPNFKTFLGSLIKGEKY